LSDSFKAVNPFLDRIPRELHEEYFADCWTEIMKLNMEGDVSIQDGGISFAYGLIVAYARKP
jgi:hypothetical protein